jgi:hypothetical protein
LTANDRNQNSGAIMAQSEQHSGVATTNNFCIEKEEYLTLRKEIENTMNEITSLEKNCLLANAAVFTWIITTGKSANISKFVTLIPFFLTCFGAALCLSLNRHLGTISKYIRCIEERNNKNNPKIGWEHYFNEEGRGFQGKVRTGYWVALLVGTLSIGLYIIFYTPR